MLSFLYKNKLLKSKEKMTETMKKRLSQLVQERKQIAISESIQIVKALLERTEEMHKTEQHILVLLPDYILVEKVAGEYQLLFDTGNRKTQNLFSADSTEKIATIATYQTAAIESIGFRAPELAVTDPTRIGKQTDYYSIAAIFYYCLTGKKVSRFQMFYSGVPDISEVIYRNCMDKQASLLLYKILKKGLAPALKNRYQSEKQMRDDLIKLQKYVK